MGQAAGKEKHDETVDGGALVPQGVYTAEQDFSHQHVRAFIQNRKLAPFYKGVDDEDTYREAPFNTECPICFLYYPSPLNFTRCCEQPICTECFVQIKRADPNHTNPPSSEPAACPYCMETDFGVVYKPPILKPGSIPGMPANEAGSSGGASAGAAAMGSGKRRKSFGHTDPEVITIDAIRPDWQAKLAAAEAAIARRANRRIIMRQVGDRLIPIGVSSSRVGAELPQGTGPGGAIILQEGERLTSRGGGSRAAGGAEDAAAGTEGGRSRRSRQLAQYLATLSDGPDMEELMMMEAMRLSLLEHEEQQRRQAAEQGAGSAQVAQAASSATATPTATSQAQSSSASPTTRTSAAAPAPGARPSPPETATAASAAPNSTAPSPAPRTSSTSTPSAPAPAQPTAPVNLGLSSAMMAELAELIDGNEARPQQATATATTSAAAPAPAPTSSLQASPRSSPTSARSPSTLATPVSAAPIPVSSSGRIPAVSHSRNASGTGSGYASPVTGSPRPLNPNNPFRRSAAGSQGGGGSGFATPPS